MCWNCHLTPRVSLVCYTRIWNIRWEDKSEKKTTSGTFPRHKMARVGANFTHACSRFNGASLAVVVVNFLAAPFSVGAHKTQTVTWATASREFLWSFHIFYHLRGLAFFGSLFNLAAEKKKTSLVMPNVRCVPLFSHAIPRHRQLAHLGSV